MSLSVVYKEATQLHTLLPVCELNHRCAVTSQQQTERSDRIIIWAVIWASLVAQMVKTACNVGDPHSIPGSGRSPGEGNCNTLQYSYLENSMDRGDLWATVHGVTKSRTRLSN